jgi:hypothetical protein
MLDNREQSWHAAAAVNFCSEGVLKCASQGLDGCDVDGAGLTGRLWAQVHSTPGEERYQRVRAAGYDAAG